MNAIPNPSRRAGLAERLQRTDPGDERPADRELRRLRGLSADVSAACSTWLVSRGIKSRSWGDFRLGKTRVKPSASLFPEGDTWDL